MFGFEAISYLVIPFVTRKRVMREVRIHCVRIDGELQLEQRQSSFDFDLDELLGGRERERE